MKCKNCGTEVMNGAQFCHNCGADQIIFESTQQEYSSQQTYGQRGYGDSGFGAPSYQHNFQQSYEYKDVTTKDAPVWLKIVCVLFWLVGIILYFVKKEKEPVYAKSCLTFGLIGLAVEFVFGILF